MSKLSKSAAKLHNEAVALARSGRRLHEDEQAFILDNFREDAKHLNGLAGAFFTPRGLACDFAIEVAPGSGDPLRVLDLCAGIGGLSWACERDNTEHVCVEMNPDYVEIGRAVMPRATWVTGSIFDVEKYQRLGPFDVVISNPPFGRIKADGFDGRYTGGKFELRTIELASRLGRYGVFIVPQESAPFRYSGQQGFKRKETDEVQKFREQTGIEMEPNCGIDTSTYRNEWHGTSPAVEIVCCDFSRSVESNDAQF